MIVVGLNYRTTPVAVRERFTFSEAELPLALQQLKQTSSILECVIVATCNRTEIYAVLDRHHICGHHIRTFMEQWFKLPRAQFTNHLYMYEDDQAVQHLMRVACGLDSMVIGETQILGQVKAALALAQQYKTTGTVFNTLFRQAITVAKKAHSETMIGETAVSVSYAAVELGKRIFGQFSNKTVMIIGAGKMSELTAKHLYASGANRVFVVNRTFERAAQLADKFNGTPCSMEEAHRKLHEADIIISSTGSEGHVLTRAQVEAAMRKRKSRPLFLIDIAVPRDLDPSIASVTNAFLYDIDDLEGIVETNLEQRKQEAVKIERMIALELDAFKQWYKTLGVVPLIQALQTKAAAVHEDTMDSMLKKLPDLSEREVKVIRKLTKSIVNQLLQDPILRIKELADDRQADEAMELFVKLFALEEPLREVEQQGAQEARGALARPLKSSSAVQELAASANQALGKIAAALR